MEQDMFYNFDAMAHECFQEIRRLTPWQKNVVRTTVNKTSRHLPLTNKQKADLLRIHGMIQAYKRATLE
jgi:hypothetical protein